MLIWLIGTSIVLASSLALFFGERGRAARGHVFEQIATDIVTVVWLLDAQSPAERQNTLARLQTQRKRYRFSLAPLPAGRPVDAEFEHPAWAPLAHQLADRPLELRAVAGEAGQRPTLYLGTRLSDGTPFLVEASAPRPPPPPPRTLAAFICFIAGLILLTWFAVRFVTRPLRRLAQAALALGEDLDRPPLPDEGPEEVRHASRAFNHMQEKIRGLFAERTRLLAAITHDLQTPITRLRLRAELLDDSTLREKTLADLAEMAALVADGLAYAKTMSPATEPIVATHLDVLLDALVADYRDSQQPVTLTEVRPVTIATRPQGLRRLLSNLIDNALKFAGPATVALVEENDAWVIRVDDDGPGIAEAELSRVYEPFYRLEGSRNRDSGGTGLGLAIARQLAQTLSAQLHLQNRPGGGLRASLHLPKSPVAHA
ncbi:MAG TPA: ATP-binding protein [Accumulibacter sp.]|nr:ATP-binding protein [Accumulibacter sp.]HMW16234.1 ATP-binding protein [Accumulibacter sp.]HMX21415.1 ATP-binding protein [Accumulibacter sp.]HMY05909.1 ATP-binding protein [Accumulibacter sp.]HND79569.1 ATP-binding protein [Accumulibacter sp.]